ncbi:glutamate formimidoyltransferase [Anaerolineales bacterium]
MMKRIVECVANFSEGQDQTIVEAIVEAIKVIDEVQVLAYESDRDHNRSVVTFIGSPEQIGLAAFEAIRVASERIDLRKHRGVHPRIGAADVVPFIPIRGVSLKDCIKIAEELGERVARELGIPVYLYDAAARIEARQNLANVRRGGYENLCELIQTDVARKPDFGPAKMGPAGATVIGARELLIAFNIYLETDQVKLAQDIAKQIRASSGGFPFVRAIGVLVNERAQVSINFIDYRKTALKPVFDRVQTLAQALGTEIHSSELIGLIPEDALIGLAKAYLKLDNLSEKRLLYQAIEQSQSDSLQALSERLSEIDLEKTDRQQTLSLLDTLEQQIQSIRKFIQEK